MVEVVEYLPYENGYYLVDPEHGIPQGTPVEPKGVDWAYLARVLRRVGPVGRGIDYGRWADYRWNVNLFDGPSSAFGAAVEAPEGLRAENAATP